LNGKLSFAQEFRCVLTEYSAYTIQELTTCLDIVQLMIAVYTKLAKLETYLIKPAY
jgi:hypothetical protein